MTPAALAAFALLLALFAAAIRNARRRQPETSVSEAQRRRRLETQMRAQDERYFGEWYAK